MTPTAKHPSNELTRKQSKRVAILVRRARKWLKIAAIREKVAVGQVPVIVSAQLRPDIAKVELHAVSVSTRSRQPAHRRLVSGSIGQAIRTVVEQFELVSSLCPKMAKLWAKRQHQIVRLRKRAEKMAAKLGIAASEFLERHVLPAVRLKKKTAGRRAKGSTREHAV